MSDPRTPLELLAERAEHQHAHRPGSAANNNPARELAVRKEMIASGVKGISGKWYSIMTMQLRGLTQIEISKQLNMTSQTVSNIQRSERYRVALKARLDGLDEELYALKPKAIQAFTNGLVSSNTDTALRAATEFFKITGTGTYGKQEVAASGISAEALAKNLLLAAKQEVHIHIDRGEAPASPIKLEDSSK
jgi:transcriptional regulator with XRE-family HTH domain